ncbi:MAG: peptidoglycan-binding protein [Firmicutes bacterium]|nr:peptidoglycan-binding protein [Bacillota bacterium]
MKTGTDAHSTGKDLGREKPLRLGSRGEAVRNLQERLSAFGYDPGPPDGVYGYLTRDAVRRFQGEWRLRVDGIAGREALTTLFSDALKDCRSVHLVRQGETLADIAGLYGASEQAISASNHLRRGEIYSGQRLVIHRSALLGVLTSEAAEGWGSGLRTRFSRWSNYLTGVILLSHRLTEEGGIDTGNWDQVRNQLEADGHNVIPTIHNLLQGTQWRNRDALDHVLRNRRARQLILERLPILASGSSPWLAADFGSVEVNRRGFLGFIGALSRVTHEAGKKLLLAFSPGARPGWGSLRERELWRAMDEYCDRVVVCVRDPASCEASPSGGSAPYDELRSSLKTLAHSVPGWKTMLCLPVHARKFAGAGPEVKPGVPISYQTAVTMAHRLRARAQWDPASGSWCCRGTEDHEPVEVWYDNRDSFALKLKLVTAHRLSGVVVWMLGYEDTRIWAAVRDGLVLAPRLT